MKFKVTIAVLVILFLLLLVTVNVIGAVRTCTVCSKGQMTGKLSLKPTCEDDGEWTYTCNNPSCGATETEPEPAIGHDYIITTGEVTCEDDGYTITRCNRCDYRKEEIEPALGHVYKTTTKAATCEDDGYTITT